LSQQISHIFAVALECFVEHSELFGPWLLRDYFKWFVILKDFAELKMAEDYKIGLKALNKLMEQSARHLNQENDSNRRKKIISVKISQIMNLYSKFKMCLFYLYSLLCWKPKKF